MNKKLKRIVLLTILLFDIFTTNFFVHANISDAIQKGIENYKLNDVINTLEEYVEDVNLDEVKQDLLEGNGIEISNFFNAIINMLFKEIKLELKTAVEILMVLVLLGLIKCLELEKGSINKVINILSFGMQSQLIVLIQDIMQQR